ncbi:hypothetical protein KFK09_019755 [Dendrobium nobile]|uniref:START domain-containing protein n=1 Tax=Dendrobium nobile TaxID=94219 RepID=A0A8T3AS08_DENNO|nr:hypothetical protein KFK09_019755 [Dendrobium nobile]
MPCFLSTSSGKDVIVKRCREKQRKEASRLQTVKKANCFEQALNGERMIACRSSTAALACSGIQSSSYYDVLFTAHSCNHFSVLNNSFLHASAATTDNSCESVVTSGQHQQQHNAKLQHFQRDANNPAGLLAIAEETLQSSLKGNWNFCRMGSNVGRSLVRILLESSLSHTIAVEWQHELAVLSEFLKLVHLGITYAPTTLAAARDFWTLRYTTGLEDGSLVICERSLTSSTGGPPGPPAPNFVRAEMLSSGYLIRPCEGGGSMIHIVDHVDLDAKSVPEVLRPLYESPKIVAHKMTIAALRHLRQIAHETSGEVVYSGGRQPAVLRTLVRDYNIYTDRKCLGNVSVYFPPVTRT